MDASKRRFLPELGPVYELLCQAAADDGRMKVHEIVRSKALEAETGKRSGTVVERVLPLDSYEYFGRLGGQSVLANIIEALQKLAVEYATTDEKTTKQLFHLSQRKAKAVELAEKLLAKHRGWRLFYKQKNLERVAYWATVHPNIPGTCSTEEGKLTYIPDETGVATSIDLHPNYAPLDDAVLRLLE
jgi:hypothetical protein